MRALFLLLLAQLLLSGCGMILSKASHNPSVRNYDNLPDLRQGFRESSIACGSSDCPDFIGGLYSKSLKGGVFNLASCSGTLVGPNTFLTNSHCVPSEINYQTSGCSTHLRIVFPQNQDHLAESFDCERIEKISSLDGEVDTPDYALIRFSGTTTRSPAPINQKGVSSDARAYIYKINYTPTGHLQQGVVTKTHCLLNTNHLLSDRYIGEKDSQSALLNVSHCSEKLIGGNSGSAILNANKQVVGVLSYMNPVEDSDDYSAMTSRYRNLKQDVGGGTNAACIPFNDAPLSPFCEFDHGVYSLLSSYYTLLRKQQFHPSFIEEGELAIEGNSLNSTSQNFVTFKSFEDSDWDRVELSTYGAMAKHRQMVAKKAFRHLFPVIPNCILPTAPDKFVNRVSGRLLVRFPSEVEADSLRETFLSEATFWDFEFTKDILQGNYIMWVGTQFNLDIRKKFRYGELLMLERKQDFKIEVPVCEETDS